MLLLFKKGAVRWGKVTALRHTCGEKIIFIFSLCNVYLYCHVELVNKSCVNLLQGKSVGLEVENFEQKPLMMATSVHGKDISLILGQHLNWKGQSGTIGIKKYWNKQLDEEDRKVLKDLLHMPDKMYRQMWTTHSEKLIKYGSIYGKQLNVQS